MARHRNVRAMDLDEEYEGYYSCYGHSVEDDACISPHTEAQFLYDRSRKNQSFSAFMNLHSTKEVEECGEDNLPSSNNCLSHEGSQPFNRKEGDLNSVKGEECDEDIPPSNLSNEGSQLFNATDHAKLQSCIEAMQDVVGDTIAERYLYKAAVDNNFDFEKALDDVLTNFGTCNASGDASVAKVQCSNQKSSDSELNEGKEIPCGEKNAEMMANVTSTEICCDENDLSDNLQLHSGNVTSNAKPRTSKNILQLYQRERGTEKPLLNLVVVGHVDAGKSTLMGNLLFRLGCVSKKMMHKYEQESKKVGKASFMYAWVLDETSEERNRGITMDVAQSKFETPHRTVNLLDAPGHKDFIPNMITGAAQADVAILVVDATRGEFETGFETGGQTREHTMLIRSLGVSQLAVAVNKMDNVNWEKERYSEVVSKLSAFLKQAGFKDSDVQFAPCSGLTGENLTKPPEEVALKKWYTGPTLVEVIDSLKPPERPVMKPLRMCVNDVFKGMGSGFCVSGRIETGAVQSGEKVLLMPLSEQAVIKGITIDETVTQRGFAGDHVILQLSGIDMNNVSSINIICDIENPVKITSCFEAQLVVFNVPMPITNGFPVILHYRSLTEQATITKLISQLHRSTGELLRRRPRCLAKHSSAVVEISLSRPICLELYKNFKDLGRFMLRFSSSTIAAGVVTKII